MSIIETFAEAHRLHTKLDECGERIIPGKQGQIHEYSDSELGVMFMMPNTDKEPWGRWCPKLWGNFRRAAVAAGMIVRQNADSEGCLSFDPRSRAQSKLAIQIARVRPKKVLSEEQKAVMASRLALARQARTANQQILAPEAQVAGQLRPPFRRQGHGTGFYPS